MLRACSKCSEPKPFTAFQAAKGYADGYQRQCKACVIVAKREWRARGGYKRERSTPAAKERQLRWKRGRAKDHPSRRADVARVSRWVKAKPLWRKAAGSRRRARQHGVEPSVTGPQLEELFTLYAGLCAYCTGRATEIDHLVPFACRGSDEIGNIVPVCESCNSSKQDKPLIVWMAQRAA